MKDALELIDARLRYLQSQKLDYEKSPLSEEKGFSKGFWLAGSLRFDSEISFLQGLRVLASDVSNSSETPNSSTRCDHGVHGTDCFKCHPTPAHDVTSDKLPDPQSTENRVDAQDDSCLACRELVKLGSRTACHEHAHLFKADAQDGCAFDRAIERTREMHAQIQNACPTKEELDDATIDAIRETQQGDTK